MGWRVGVVPSFLLFSKTQTRCAQPKPTNSKIMCGSSSLVPSILSHKHVARNQNEQIKNNEKKKMAATGTTMGDGRRLASTTHY